jgi:DNA uptake protein ComE-like DNA-binding protein
MTQLQTQSPDQILPSTAVEQKLTTWKNEPSIQVLKGDLEAAKPSHDAQVAKINHWIELTEVKGKAAPQKIKGRSSVQPKLIRRQAEWRYPALTEPFLGSNKLFKVSPTSWEDKKAADQNELVLNWQFKTKMNRVKFIDDFVRCTVDEGTSVVRLGWKRVTTKIKQQVPVFKHFQIETQEQLLALQQAISLAQEDPHTYADTVPPEMQSAVSHYQETGQATYAVQAGVETVLTDKLVENRPTIEVIDIRNFYLDPSCNGDPSKALFAVVSFETNKAELLKEPQRYKNLDQVNWEGASAVQDPDHATNTPQDFQFRDAPRKKVVAYEYWGVYDVNGDGTLVPIVATWIANTMVRMELNPFPDQKIPFVVVPYLPIKRAAYGEPDAEVLEDNQKILGAVTRGMIDLLGRSANGQQGFAKGMLDVVNRRRYENGQDYEFNPNMPVQNGLIEHKYPELPNSALTMVQLMNQDAEALTGVKSFSGGMSGEAYGDVAAGIRGALDAASKREMAILRRLATGMSEIGSKVISMNQAFMSDKEVVRVTNEEFVSVNRDELIGNFDLDVDISTAEVDNQKSQDLAFMMQTMGPTTDWSFRALILSEIAKLKRMPELAHKIATFQPQPDPFQQQMQQLEAQKLQSEIAKNQAQAQMYEAQARAAGATADKTNLDYVEQETGTKHARDMEKQAGQAEGNQALAVTNALLKPRKQANGAESKPDIPAAVGYNALSKAQSGAGQQTAANPTIPQVNFGVQPAPVNQGIPA